VENPVTVSEPVAVRLAAAEAVTPMPDVPLPARVMARSFVPEPADKAARRLTPPVVPLPVREMLPVVAVMRLAPVVVIPCAPEERPMRVMSPEVLVSTPESEMPSAALATPTPRPTVLLKSIRPVSEIPAVVLMGAPLVRTRRPD
jgi:hypothetical protein